MVTEQPLQTFSPQWHRVGQLRPRLLPHVGVRRDRFRGRRWHILTDPAGARFYRLDAAGYDMVARLDGSRSVDEAWRAVVALRGDAAPTQAEALAVIAGLHAAGLLAAGPGREAEAVIERARETRVRSAIGRVAMPLAVRIPIFNPDAVITAVEPLLRPVLSRIGLVLWLVLLSITAWRAWPEGAALWADVQAVLRPEHWGIAVLSFVVSKAWHELGHGVICKSLGARTDPDGELGRVSQFGVVLIALFPAPYVDTSSSWALPGKWARAAVGAGGMLFELVLAAIAVNLWLIAEPGSVLSLACASMVLVAGVTTLVFNANPLVKFDGYYILSDLAETPNLAKRSADLLGGIAARLLYGVPVRQGGESRVERAFLLAYGLAAAVYRVMIVGVLALLVAGRLHGIGIVLAIWAVALFLLVPLWKLLKYLSGSQALRGKRGGAWLATLGVAAIVLGVVGLVPVPDTRRAVGMIESVARTPLYVAEPGFVEAAPVRSGERVEAGELVLALRSPDLVAERAEAEARRMRAEADEREASTKSESEAIVARRRLAALASAADRLAEREASLSVVAPHGGVLVGRDPTELEGRHVPAGGYLGDVVDPASLRVAVELEQGEADWHFALGRGGYGVRLRAFGSPSVELIGSAIEVTEAAAVLQASGEARRAFMMRIGGFERDGVSLDGPVGLPGERVAVRFDLPHRPLLAQWTDGIRRALQGRLTPGVTEVAHAGVPR
ncbi:MAG: hypothetical protein AAGB51_08730 [Planctomycetota bacterium]